MKDEADEQLGKWKCEYTLDHADLLSRESKDYSRQKTSRYHNTDETLPELVIDDDKPQVYALRFIDHWKVFTEDICQEQSAQNQNPKEKASDNDHNKNSFLMTSSDEFIHLWEVEGHPFDRKLTLDDQKNSYPTGQDQNERSNESPFWSSRTVWIWCDSL